MGLTQLLPVEVDHCPDAYGFVLTHKTGWKLVYEFLPFPLFLFRSHIVSLFPFSFLYFSNLLFLFSHILSRFSGDTRPCKKLNAAGEGASVLIHEATFEDDLAQEAIEKNHSTTAEAIGAALEYVPFFRGDKKRKEKI